MTDRARLQEITDGRWITLVDDGVETEGFFGARAYDQFVWALQAIRQRDQEIRELQEDLARAREIRELLARPGAKGPIR